MKKIKLTGKLILNKETIATLNNQQMSGIYGGGSARECASIVDTYCDNPSDADGACNWTVSEACQATDAAAGCPVEWGYTNGYTCCAPGSWNHSSCGGSRCGGFKGTIACTTNPH